MEEEDHDVITILQDHGLQKSQSRGQLLFNRGMMIRTSQLIMFDRMKILHLLTQVIVTIGHLHKAKKMQEHVKGPK
jgi:hypothetical protein